MSYGGNYPDNSYGSGASSNYYNQNESFSAPSHGSGNEYSDTRYDGPGRYSGGDDFSSAAAHASSHHDKDSSLFSSALSFLNEHKDRLGQSDKYEVDEEHVLNSHNKMYGSGDEERSHDSGTVGSGAAMQALKMFTSSSGSEGAGDKNKLIGLAMAQAGKLWDEKQGKGDSMVSSLPYCFDFEVWIGWVYTNYCV